MSRFSGFRSAVVLLVACALALTLVASVSAQQYNPEPYDPQSGDPPPAQHQEYNITTWPVQATPDGAGIQGTITLENFSDNKDELYVRLKHLPPHQIYTVWLTRKDGDIVERAQVAQGWSGARAKKISFESFHNGTGYMRGCLHECPFGRWKYVEVRYHPKGNVADLQSSVVVVRVRLREN